MEERTVKKLKKEMIKERDSREQRESARTEEE